MIASKRETLTHSGYTHMTITTPFPHARSAAFGGLMFNAAHTTARLYRAEDARVKSKHTGRHLKGEAESLMDDLFVLMDLAK
jgi:hypothetical protein